MISVALLSLGVAACGGGGSPTPPVSSPPPPTTPPPAPPPPPPPITNFDDAEYRRSNAAVDAKAIAAYEEGATGAGVKIAIIDTGLNPALSDFAGRVDPASGDVAGNRGVSDVDGHGTAVTAIAAAARDGDGILGVAFDATIISLRADSPGTCGTASGCTLLESNIATGIDQAVAGGAVVINLSLGGGAPSQPLLNAMQRAVNAGIILVIAAGNDGNNVPADGFAAVPASRFPGQVIVAGSLGILENGTVNTNKLSDFSNNASGAQNAYLGATGFRVRAPDHTGEAFLWSGTSFSAPVITGAVALLKQAFPNLTGRQITEILFNSADDLGAPGVDSTFGHGRLNIEAAFQPQGATALAGTGERIALSGNGTLPAAAGDAAGHTTMGARAIFLDRYQRAYQLDLARTLDPADSNPSLGPAFVNSVESRASRFGNLEIDTSVRPAMIGLADDGPERLGLAREEWREARLVAASAVARLSDRTAMAFGYGQGADAMQRRLAEVASDDFIAARRDTLGFAAAREEGFAVRHDLGPLAVGFATENGNVYSRFERGVENTPYRYSQVSADAGLIQGGRARAGFGLLEEKETFLGGRLNPQFASGGADTRFAFLGWHQQFGERIALDLEARRGWTRADNLALTSEAFSADLSVREIFTGTDRLGLRVAQPLRVRSGGLELWMPTGWDWQSETASFGDVAVPFTPSGREIRGEASYSRGLLGGSLTTNVFYRKDPGHVASGEDDMGAAIRFTLGL
nr:S8 family peptidase [Sphingomicrobium lutaoense]